MVREEKHFEHPRYNHASVTSPWCTRSLGWGRLPLPPTASYPAADAPCRLPTVSTRTDGFGCRLDTFVFFTSGVGWGGGGVKNERECGNGGMIKAGVRGNAVGDISGSEHVLAQLVNRQKKNTHTHATKYPKQVRPLPQHAPYFLKYLLQAIALGAHGVALKLAAQFYHKSAFYWGVQGEGRGNKGIYFRALLRLTPLESPNPSLY